MIIVFKITKVFTLLRSVVSKLVKDVTGNVPLNSPSWQGAVVGKLVEEEQGTDHIRRQVNHSLSDEPR